MFFTPFFIGAIGTALGLLMNTATDSSHHNTNESKVFLVTGATGAIGKAIACLLAENQQHEVVLLGRNQQKTAQAAKEIMNSTQNPKVHFEIADLSRLADIQNLVARWHRPLHVLVNNAACTPRTRQETSEGIELQFATNVLGYFWLINEFSEILKASAPARIVNVASYWAGGLDLNDLEFKHRHYDNDDAYRQSKQADRMLTVAFAEKLKPYQISVNACHPGDVHSTLSQNLGFGGHETPTQGARTPVWLATNAIGQLSSGKYFERLQESACSFSTNKQAINALFEACLKY